MNITQRPTLSIQEFFASLWYWILPSVLVVLILTACGTPVIEATATPTASATVTKTPSATAVPSPAPTNTTEPKSVVAIGDSLVSGGKLAMHEGHESTIKGGWVTRLQARLDEDYPGEYQTVNMGVSGRTVLGIKPVLPEALGRNPAIILIQVGGNDFGGSYSDERFTTLLENFELRMREIVEQILQESPETDIYLVGYPVSIKKYAELSYSFLNYDDQEVLDFRYQQFNNVLESVSIEYGIYFIDILTSWPEEEEARWALSADGLHPDDAGFKFMTDIIYDAILRSLDTE